MTKNEIILEAIKSLTEQRAALTEQLISINFSDNNAMSKESSIKGAIFDIDVKIDNYINSCEYKLPPIKLA